MWGGLLQVCAYTLSPFWSERNCFISSKWWLVSQHQNACIRTTETKYVANWPREIELVCIQRLKAGAEDQVIASLRWDIAKLFLYQGRRTLARVMPKVLSTVHVYTCSICYQERVIACRNIIVGYIYHHWMFFVNKNLCITVSSLVLYGSWWSIEEINIFQLYFKMFAIVDCYLNV